MRGWFPKQPQRATDAAEGEQPQEIEPTMCTATKQKQNKPLSNRIHGSPVCAQ
jgi:hypothetical protein